MAPPSYVRKACGRYVATNKTCVLVSWIPIYDRVVYARGGHTPLCFVTTCDNGVFNGGVFMHFSINFPTLFVDIKLL